MSTDPSSDLLYDVFLSYSRDDTKVMQRIYKYLTTQRFIVWSDVTHILPGSPSWTQAVSTGIEQSCCVVAVFSPSAKISKWVEKETHYAEVQKKQVFPVLAVGEVQDAIPFRYIDAQWIDIRSDVSFSKEMEVLVMAIRENSEIEARSSRRAAGEKDIHQLATQTAKSPQSGIQRYTFRGPADEDRAVTEATAKLTQLLGPIPDKHFICAISGDKMLIRSLIAYERTEGSLVHSKEQILKQAHNSIEELGNNAFQHVLSSVSAAENYPELHRDEVITINMERSEHRMSPNVIVEITAQFTWRSEPDQ